jgi:hypothetical protein
MLAKSQAVKMMRFMMSPVEAISVQGRAENLQRVFHFGSQQ